MDKLDELLKSYIKIVRTIPQLSWNAFRMPSSSSRNGNRRSETPLPLWSVSSPKAREQLKAMYKRKLIDTMGKAPDEAAIIDEAYTELEKDLTHRIAGLEHQIDVNIDSRNHLLQKANRAAKTVIEVFLMTF